MEYICRCTGPCQGHSAQKIYDLMEKQKTLTEISRIVGITRERVRQIVRKVDTEYGTRTWLRKYMYKTENHPCPICGAPTYKRNTHCSTTCFSKSRQVDENCSICGKVINRRKSSRVRHPKYPTCSLDCKNRLLWNVIIPTRPIINVKGHITTKEAALFLGLHKNVVSLYARQGKYSGAYKTDVGQWVIPLAAIVKAKTHREAYLDKVK